MTTQPTPEEDDSLPYFGDYHESQANNHSLTQNKLPLPEEVKKLLERMKDQYQQIEHKVVDPKQDFFVSNDESDRLIKFWTELHNAFPTLLSLASQSLTATQRADALAEEVKSTMAAWQDAIGVQPYPKARIVGNLALTTKNIVEERAMFETQLTAAQEREGRLRAALERIERWHGEFPPTGKTWDDGSPLSYSAAYGSNGERDYMREVAREALSTPPSDAGKAGYAPFRERIRALAKDLREAGYEYPSDCVAVADFDCPDAAPTPSTEGKGGES